MKGQTMDCMWYKLKDDTWGIKIKNGSGSENQQVQVTNKNGDEKTVTLNVRKAKFDDAELWSIKNQK